jgi:hypothetical protein
VIVLSLFILQQLAVMLQQYALYRCMKTYSADLRISPVATPFSPGDFQSSLAPSLSKPSRPFVRSKTPKTPKKISMMMRLFFSSHSLTELKMLPIKLGATV